MCVMVVHDCVCSVLLCSVFCSSSVVLYLSLTIRYDEDRSGCVCACHDASALCCVYIPLLVRCVYLFLLSYHCLGILSLSIALTDDGHPSGGVCAGHDAHALRCVYLFLLCCLGILSLSCLSHSLMMGSSVSGVCAGHDAHALRCVYLFFLCSHCLIVYRTQ